MVLNQVRQVGEILLRTTEHFGRFIVFCFMTTAWGVDAVRRPKRWRLLWPQLYEVGTRSIPVVMLTGGFIGMVFAVELYEQFKNYGQEQQLGGVVGLSVVSHLGPVLAAVMLAGRVGGAFAAELGTMIVTEQVDALRVMGAAPLSYLVVPRVLACVIMIPVMTVFSDLLGIIGSWGIAVGLFHTSNADYWANTARFVGMWDMTTGLLKSVFFGVAIGLISCHKGFHTRPGAEGVGRATTDAFVTSFIAIMILNFFLAKFSNDLYVVLFGPVHFSAFG